MPLALAPALSQPHYLIPDSAAHVAWVRSLVFDRDIDFANDYARLGMIEREGEIAFGAATERGRAGNPFGLGSAIAWAPPVLVAAAVAGVAASAGSAVATDGFGSMLLFAVHCGTWTWAVATWMWTWAALGRLLPASSARARRLAMVAAFLGSSWLYYVLQLGTYAHAAAAAAAAAGLALAVWIRERGWTTRRALALGAVAGVGALVRPQDAVLAFVPLVVAGASLRDARFRPGLVAYVAGFVVVAALQTLAWSHLYGATLVPPQGAGFLALRPAGLVGVLFASRHGWFVWSPVVVLALVGAVFLARRPATRSIGICILVAAGLEWLVNSAALDWWAGWSFGARRFTTLVPLLALGLVAFVERGRGARIAAWVATVAGLVQWLRVSTRDLSADADPGFAALWGSGFLSFLPQVPQAIVTWLRTPWTDLQVLRRPGAPGLELHPDSPAVQAIFFLVWCVLLVVGSIGWRRFFAARNS